MNGLLQIQAVQQDQSFFLIGLDNRGNVWHGRPVRDGGNWRIEWQHMKDEIVE